MLVTLNIPIVPLSNLNATTSFTANLLAKVLVKEVPEVATAISAVVAIDAKLTPVTLASLVVFLVDHVSTDEKINGTVASEGAAIEFSFTPLAVP